MVPGRRLSLATRAAVLLGAVLCWTGSLAAAEPQKITVGSKTFTESVILGEILSKLVRQTGGDADHRKQLGGTRILWNALLRGDIDMYPEYTGTIVREILADKTISKRSDIHEALGKQGISMSWPLGFNNTYAIGVKPPLADKLGLATISDLARHRDLRLGFSNEFMDRGDGWPALKKLYKLKHEKVKGLDHDLAYRGLQAGDIDAIDVYTTDAEIAYYGLRLLEDDLQHFPAYDAVILYRTVLRQTAPGVVRAIRQLEGAINAKRMAGLNATVKISGKTENSAATEFLSKDLGIDQRAADETGWNRFWRHTFEHLMLVGISLTAAILIAIPLGI
ncbi:MAG: amino acid ABC transporter permease, partial [Rhodospirillaceae bacterium]|nr:amino acid ABC transporter permease [Rhodospirillaceae bacterium]